jgi:hypothetical protein
MGKLKRAADILPLMLKFKDCVIVESVNSGKISISQDLLNIDIKKIILSKLDNINDYDCDFYLGEITITKKVLLLPITIKLNKLNFIINGNDYKFTAKHGHSVVIGILDFIGVLPNFIRITEEDFEIDFTKIEGFGEIKTRGAYGVDFLNTIELAFDSCKEGYLIFSYKFI